MTSSPGMRLVEFRRTKGLSQRKFALEIGVSRAAVTLVEGDFRSPSRSFLQKISARYDLSSDWLLFGSGEQLIDTEPPSTSTIEAVMMREAEGKHPLECGIWHSKHPPAWWRDVAVRTFILKQRGRETLTDTAKKAKALYGKRAPSRSAVQRIWSRIEHWYDAQAADLPKSKTDVHRAAEALDLIQSITDPDMFGVVGMIAKEAREHAAELAQQSQLLAEVAIT